MIRKQLIHHLGSTNVNWEPCLFTIVTSLGGIEHAIGYTKESLWLIFCVGAGTLYAHLLLKCAVTSGTNYDILVGQQAIYPLDFGLDNLTKEV